MKGIALIVIMLLLSGCAEMMSRTGYSQPPVVLGPMESFEMRIGGKPPGDHRYVCKNRRPVRCTGAGSTLFCNCPMGPITF